MLKSRQGKHKGQKVTSPMFKKKSHQQSARFCKGGFSIKAAQVYLAKIGCIKARWSRLLSSEPSSATMINDSSGRYFLSFVVMIQPDEVHGTNPAVGIDLGLKTFAVISSGKQVHSPDYQQLERKIRRSQRKLSLRCKGLKRCEVRLKVAKLKATQAETHNDFLYQLSTRVVNENQGIALEDLNV
jgi:putative transposase